MKTLAAPRDADEILQRLRTLRSEHAARWGRMSAHQMVCHLSDSLRMMMGEKSVSPATGPFQRFVLKWIVLYAPLEWPAGIATLPEVDQEQGGTRPLEFAADLAQLEALVARVTTRPCPVAPSHPLFGAMSETAWYRWAYLHLDHHLRQFGV